MSYKLLRQDSHPDNWSVLCVEDVEVHLLNRGVPLTEPPSLARVTLSALGLGVCDYLESPCPIVSDRMRRAFEGVGVENLEWYPAELKVEIVDTLHTGYWIMNVIGRVACVDQGASDVEQAEDGTITELRCFRCDPQRAYDMDLFRLAEDSQAIMVSDRIQEALLSAGLRGVLLQDPATYNRGLPVSSFVRRSP